MRFLIVKSKRMKLNVYKPSDSVKVCNQKICIEARGENGRAIVNAICFAAICIGIATLIKSIK